jgi:predicted PurR-regulated permease PerM
MTLSASPEARRRAGARWRGAADRLRSIGPGALGRGLLALAVLALGGWLSVATWPALAPFLVGAVIAYAVLPVANRLDRVMPRVLAALIAELVALGLLVGVVLVVVPPLLNALVQVALRLPSGDGVRETVAQLQAQLGDLPEPIRSILLSVLTETTTGLSAALNGAVQGAGSFLTQQILGLLGTATFLLGLLVIPAWILTMVSDERRIMARATRFIAPAARADVLAVVRIADRALATFLRIRVLLAIVTAALIWAGLEISRELGIADFPYAVAGAVLLGAFQLIPQLGFFLGLFPIALVLAISGPVPALVSLAVFAGAGRVASLVVEGRMSRGVLDVHPGLLIPAIVVLSEFGLVWLFVSAPVVAIARDLVRYVAGRLADPPRPAGVLPGERSRMTAVPAAAPVRAVYRDRVASRPVVPSASAPALPRSPVP